MVPTARILADRRLLVSVLAVLAVANFIGLAMVVGPIRSRVQTLTQRATAASLAVTTATRDLAAARQTSAGSVQAVTELQRFYGRILPANPPGGFGPTGATGRGPGRRGRVQVSGSDEHAEHAEHTAHGSVVVAAPTTPSRITWSPRISAPATITASNTTTHARYGTHSQFHARSNTRLDASALRHRAAEAWS